MSQEFNASSDGFDDFIDWTQFGDDWSVISAELETNQGVSSGEKINFTITNPLQLVKLTQGKRDNWRGNFKTGEAVLYTDHLPGPINITFDPPVLGFRTQVQINEIPDGKSDPIPFKTRITFYDSKGAKIKTVTTSKGSSSGASDGSAVAMQFVSARKKIKYVKISVKGTGDGAHDNDFAINRIDLKTVVG
jgi:hypothetical protein